MTIVVGYAVMHGLAYALPLHNGNFWIYLLFSALLIALGLAAPYWMLKLGAHRAHIQNPEEKELKMEDIPKEQPEVRPREPVRRA